MNITSGLLYLLLLYAVLDKEGKLSLNSGLVLAFVVMLFTCCRGNSRGRQQLSPSRNSDAFSSLNGC